MIPWAHPIPQPKRHLYRFSRFCTDDRRVSLYCTIGRPFPQKLPLRFFPIWGSRPHLAHGSPGQPESSTQTASRSVQPFCRLTSVTDRPTDHATRSVTVGRASTYVLRSTAMRPKNSKCISEGLMHVAHGIAGPLDRSLSIRGIRFDWPDP